MAKPELFSTRKLDLGYVAGRALQGLVTCFFSVNLTMVGIHRPAYCQESEVESSDVTHGQLQRLLRSLEASEAATRREAEEKIIELGPAVLPYLPSVTPQTSGEMRMRLQRIRQELDGQISDRFFQASHVSIQGRKSFRELMEEIQRQTDNPIKIPEEEEMGSRAEIEVDWQELPFWSAIDELLEAAQLRLVPFSGTSKELVLRPRESANPIQPFFSGPFRVDVSSIQSERNFSSRLDGQLRVGLVISWEPRLDPLFMNLPMDAFSAIDDQEAVLRATNPQASPEVRLNIGGSSTQVELQLQRPERESTILKSFSGSFSIAVPGNVHEYSFEKLGTEGRQVQEFGDLTVTLEGARRNGPVFETRLFVQFGDPVGALESFRGWITSNRAFMVDADGKKLENVGFQTYAATGTGVGVAYLFQLDGEPENYQLIYESPSSVNRKMVEFELLDIPLP